MRITLKPELVPATLETIRQRCLTVDPGLRVRMLDGFDKPTVGVIGRVSQALEREMRALTGVEVVERCPDAFKLGSRFFHPKDTVITLANGTQIGGGAVTLMAGPCSVESREQILSVARSVAQSGATVLRGGAFKPRTSPYEFQGLRAEGLELMLEAKKETGLPIITEIMSEASLHLFEDVDILQVGARSMQNFELLKCLGQVNKPVMLKRGIGNTIQELLLAAEYILAHGNENVLLCERGIRTYETATRTTLDLSAIPVLKEKTHLPLVVDPSHSTGNARWVPSMSRAAAAAGVDALLIEVHNCPQCALCDGAQSLTPEAFDDVARSVRAITAALASL